MNQQKITLGINSKPIAGKTPDTPILTAIMPLKPADKDPIPKLRKKLIIKLDEKNIKGKRLLKVGYSSLLHEKLNNE